MSNVYKEYYYLMAKSDRENLSQWLPLWMHLRDTAEIIRKLANKWVSDAVIEASGMDRVGFCRLAVFVAAVHDIGKATSYFQNVITKEHPDKFEHLNSIGYKTNRKYLAQGKTPHAHAGQWILQSDSSHLQVCQSIANVVGAHHGKPINSPKVNGESDLLKIYPVNFYGSEEKEDQEIWQRAWKRLLDQALTLSGYGEIDVLPDISTQCQVLLSGLLIVADWVASNTGYFPLLDEDDFGKIYLEDANYERRVNRGWQAFHPSEGWFSEVQQMDEESFENRFGFIPNVVQKAMIQIVESAERPGIFILEAQMGIGKTEAALGAAEILANRQGEGGIFFGLPTQATSNGLFHRLLPWAQKVSEDTYNSIQLAQGAAQFNSEYRELMDAGGTAHVNDIADTNENDYENGVEVHPWFQGNKRVLLADFVVGTIDQFLMASLKRKHFMLRHLGLAGKVVVIDECHAYDAYMNQYLQRSLEWMAAYGVPVILLSATLPAQRRSELVKSYVKSFTKYHLSEKWKPGDTNWEQAATYPLITWSDGAHIRQSNISQEVDRNKLIKIETANSVAIMIAQLNKALQNGGCACIIANTVKKAQDIYEAVSGAVSDATVLLYHAQFTMPDRAKKEGELIRHMGRASNEEQRYRYILIGTQVLEQSLDYDADIMVTELCPVDLLLQRIGRLHRHNRIDQEGNNCRPSYLQNARCIILQSDEKICDKGTEAVYGKYLLIRTYRVLGETVRIPGDIPKLVQKVYDSKDDLGLKGDEYQAAKEEFSRVLQEKEQKAKVYRLEKPQRRGLRGMLQDMDPSKEKDAEASVRDTGASVEVLIMKKGRNGNIYFLDENEEKKGLSPEYVPEINMARKIASQRIKLPYVFCTDWNISRTIRELEEMNRTELPEWQNSPWLKSEVILLFNDQNRAILNNYRLTYDSEKGLRYEREEDGCAS